MVNADESEPGTFKDRELMTKNPHQLIEGIVLAAYAIRPHAAYIYLRGEFAWIGAGDRERDRRGEGRRLPGQGHPRHRATTSSATSTSAPGAYICGEETALLNSLEGKRGTPRLKPPFPAVEGLYACPTVVNNMETICAVPPIVLNGADVVPPVGHGEEPGHEAVLGLGPGEEAGQLRDRRSACRCARCSTSTPAA